MSVVPLKVAAAEPDATVISTIEAWLEKAKVGDIRAIAAAYVDGAGFTWQDYFQGDVDSAKFVGAASRLVHKLNMEWGDEDE